LLGGLNVMRNALMRYFLQILLKDQFTVSTYVPYVFPKQKNEKKDKIPRDLNKVKEK
jgi:hypothetical protein